MRSRITDIGRHKRGRGTGFGANYRPWIRVHDFSSTGLVTRVYSPITRRIHHLLSRLEEKTFYFLEFMDPVDISEQYPLELKETLEIAGLSGIRHPAMNGRHTVMSTDFVVSFDGRTIAISVKPSSKLNKRTLPKLEIERQYFERRGIPFYIVTEKEIPEGVVSNIQLARHSMQRPSLVISDNAFVDCLIQVSGKYQFSVEETLRRISRERLLPYQYPELKKLFLHLIWCKRIEVVDMGLKKLMDLKPGEYGAIC